MNDNNNNNSNNNNSQELGALWKREARNTGMKYLAGHIKLKDIPSESVEGEEEMVKVVVFFNSDKRSEKSPDYRMYVSKSNFQKRDDSSVEQEKVTQKEELDDVDVLA